MVSLLGVRPLLGCCCAVALPLCRGHNDHDDDDDDGGRGSLLKDSCEPQNAPVNCLCSTKFPNAQLLVWLAAVYGPRDQNEKERLFKC